MRHLTALATALLITSAASADYQIPWQATTTVNAGGGTWMPYYIASNSGGTSPQPFGIYERAKIERPISTQRRFEYAYGIDAEAGLTSAVSYERYDAEAGKFRYRDRRPAPVQLRQLYGEIKFRGVFIYAGMKENDRSIFNSQLGSGDITLSNNARAIPQVRAGFIDFQNVPFTRGHLQIQGELAYGKFTDNGWLRKHYNYYNSFITTGSWFHYARLYLRSDPRCRFSVTLGMQHAAQFGGYYRRFSDGRVTLAEGSGVKFTDFIDMLIPTQGGSGVAAGDKVYYNGNHLGSWDFRARYMLGSGHEITAYFQWPWEDGSGIGKLNGWDGVWGIEYKAPRPGIIDGAVAEYIDFTNQSGPIHWAPADHPGTGITGEATGADNYYNNFRYNGWANYGMSLGSPFIKSTVYNRDGYLVFTDNRVRGFHIGVSGTPEANWTYRVLLSWRRSWGTPMEPRTATADNTSMLLEAGYSFPAIKGLSINARFGFDAGKLYGNNIGVQASVSYSGIIKFKSRHSDGKAL